MITLSALHLKNFKKFESFDISFNEKINILVGENESGKSTIIEAINIVLNQLYRFSDKSAIRELFNKDCVDKFKNDPTQDNLPEILIEIEFKINADPKTVPNIERFYGCHNVSKEPKYGIRFECVIETEDISVLASEILKGEVPFEYYSLRWTTFAGLPYSINHSIIKYLAIDTSENRGSSAISYFYKTLFMSRFSDEQRRDYRTQLHKQLDALSFAPLGEDRQFTINHSKIILENILSISEKGIPLENRGKGMESLIKTKIAIDKKGEFIDVLSMEEPENHLSHSTLLMMLEELSKLNSQLIVTTHNNLIASRLNIRNIFWINHEKAISLKEIDNKDAKFFEKIDNDNLLTFLLSKKVFLVEGATENLLLPKFYEQITGSTIEKDEITIISCHGISFKRYLSIAQNLNKSVAIITDNDRSEERIKEFENFNQQSKNIQFYVSKDTEKEWTWEASLYANNADKLQQIINVNPKENYVLNGLSFNDKPVLWEMLRKKVESAYCLLKSDVELTIPSYIVDSCIWLKNQ